MKQTQMKWLSSYFLSSTYPQWPLEFERIWHEAVNHIIAKHKNTFCNIQKAFCFQ